MRKVVIGLSGGMDSATLLGYYLSLGAEVHCCSFYYGSKHGQWEGRAANNLFEFYNQRGFPIIRHFFDLRSVFTNFQSNLLKSGGAIPEGHYDDESMRLTVVPGRNMIFASIMAGLAESIKADTIALGVHSGDHHIYPDCRPEFIRALMDTIEFSTDGGVRVEAPFIYEDKSTILKMGYGFEQNVPYQLTRTCYKDQEKSCGKCGSCTERIFAFNELGLQDPIPYENDWNIVLKTALALKGE
jgi:7-cyano-7-deazaguanine synthase